MPKKTKIYLTAMLFFSMFLACDSKSVFDEYRSLPNQWNKDSVVSFKVEAPDTLNNYNLFINLRNNNDFKYSNLYLITGLEYPNGKTFIDTLEYKMAAPNGELLGRGFTDLKENKLWYKGHKTPFKFTEIGTYTFKVQHAMRKFGEVDGLDNLEGVTEVGFRVENN
ncbi:gliding motility lipoprotein GldH [Winogradskyella litorisediminis]|uniref:Gliding motility lipoprotein GldH n=1 Tax=Winogradskyella litorisediminis TaxID=1156618 RepID=A0ABW3N4A5_9FLAO